MSKRIFFTFVVVLTANLLFINWSCNAPEPDLYGNLWVPYYPQECINFCGIACIQMWAHHDGFYNSQQAIANYLDVVPGGAFVSPYDVARGVAHFTCYEGCLVTKSMWVDGAQGDLIGATIRGIDYGVPSIMPYHMNHAILLKGYKWQEDNGKPFAIRVHYHDPNNRPDQVASALELELFFEPAPFTYWVIVGIPEFVDDGIDGHDLFVILGGTYYGGPSYYNPKDLELPIY